MPFGSEISLAIAAEVPVLTRGVCSTPFFLFILSHSVFLALPTGVKGEGEHGHTFPLHLSVIVRCVDGDSGLLLFYAFSNLFFNICLCIRHLPLFCLGTFGIAATEESATWWGERRKWSLMQVLCRLWVLLLGLSSRICFFPAFF